jgi:hypothetical protein
MELNEADDFVDGQAMISKHDHYFFKKVMRERVITFKEGQNHQATLNT